MADKGKGGDKGKGKGAKSKGKGPHANHYYIDGKVYDFSEWKNIHPGGPAFFAVSYQRDISAAVHAYHAHPERLTPILEKYEVDMAEFDNKEPREILTQDMNAPAFILPPNFDARRDVPTYDWDKPFMGKLRKKLFLPEMQKRIRAADKTFDITAACLLAVHVFVSFPALYLNILPGWLWIVLQFLMRTSLAGVGHYFCHRKAGDGESGWGLYLFDMQYVGASTVLSDGHVMLHHLYTETPADVKRTVFNFMITIPRLLRVPLFTAQKFGEFFTGHLLRQKDYATDRSLPLWMQLKIGCKKMCKGNRGIHSLMVAEFLWAALCSKIHLWFLQFFFVVWISIFQIVASHDFEVAREDQEYKNLDWGIFQIQHALDTYVTGIPYIDIFLSAGLSCHRTHHVLPYQKSGFANIVSQKCVEETCKEFGVEWAPARNLILDRFLPLMFHYLTVPAQIPAHPKAIIIGGGGVKGFFMEHLHPDVIVKGLRDVGRGFSGASI
jgi:hypothetical protein